MPIGINLQLFNGNTPLANLAGIQALWWDVTEPKDASRPVGKSVIVTTDASGFIKLDLSNVTGRSLGDFGFLTLYKLDAGNHQDSLVFSGKVVTSDVVGGVDMYYYDSGWTRPAGWLPLPVVGNTEQKVVGLYQVLPNSSFIAVNCAGAYTVDWGDGTVENFATGVTAQRLYDYTNSAFNGTEITVNNLTFKQAIVTITPQGGSNLTSINFSTSHTTGGVSRGWLDLLVSSPPLSALVFGFWHRALQQVQLISQNAVTDFSSMFSFCSSLESVPLLNTGAGTNFSSIFSSCPSLKTVPLLNTALGTNFSNMFNTCSSLESVPLLNTGAGTNFTSMFSFCTSLESVPLLNTGAGTNFSNMFANCSSLKTVPLLNTTLGTNFSTMLSSCSSLKAAPALNTGAGTNFTSMFSNCLSLEAVPLLNTAAGTNFSNMFFGAAALRSVPLLNTAAGTTFSNTFFNISALARGALAGTKESINYSGNNLSAVALDEIYTNLATVTAKTITVTGNWGTASDTPAIATAKGWTVTG